MDSLSNCVLLLEHHYHYNNNFVFLRQGFIVALEPVLELALVDQVDLELTEYWN